MTALKGAERPRVRRDEPTPRPLRVDRIALGLVVVAAGVGWSGEKLNADVPWRLAAPVALTLVGLLLTITVIVTRDGGQRAGRSGLAWLGAVLLVLSVGWGINATQYAAPAGNVSLAPATTEWPVAVRRSVGNVEIDLTKAPLPDRGTVSVQLGAGNVDLVVPRGSQMQIDARVTTGQVLVDGQSVGSGVDVRWTQVAATGPAVTIQLAAGEVRIRYA